MTGDPLIGRVIDEKYRIDAEIGAGGMATVYRATRLRIGDAVAIKILHPELLREPKFAERFEREAQAAARLKHPNVAAIYDFGEDGELLFLVMELVEGENLRTVIREHGPMPAAAAAEIVRQVCAALTEAHRQQIVHRDIKPANIAVEESHDGPRVKVLDFGIASLRGGTMTTFTQTGAVMGTPAYMSPEQCLGEELDGRSDIYSLGVVLFEMLCGVVPFNSPTATAVAMQHVQQAPPPLRVLNASISPAVEAVVLRALAKRREERFQTARDVGDALTTAVRGPRVSLGAETVASPAFSPLEVDATTVELASQVRTAAVREHRRKPSGAVIAIMLTVVLAAVGFGAQRWMTRGVATIGRHPTSYSSVPFATLSPSAVSYAGSWLIEEPNVRVGTIVWVGNAVPSRGDTIAFDVYKRRVAGRTAVPCERETHLQMALSLHAADQAVPFHEINCEGTISMGEVHVPSFWHSSRTFGGSFWEDGVKVGDFIARKQE
jgi:eukaryotic-like serine/threonine-protein kinase